MFSATWYKTYCFSHTIVLCKNDRKNKTTATVNGALAAASTSRCYCRCRGGRR